MFSFLQHFPLTMALVKAAIRCMERIAPLRLAGSWDNVCLQCKSACMMHSQLMRVSRLA